MLNDEKSCKLKEILKPWREKTGIEYESSDNGIAGKQAMAEKKANNNGLPDDLLPNEKGSIKDLSPETARKILKARTILDGRIVLKSGLEKKSCRRCGKPLDISWDKPLICSECFLKSDVKEENCRSKGRLLARQLEFTPIPEAIEKVRAIETEALALGWTHDQLWETKGWYDKRGLVTFINYKTNIKCITKEFIELEKISRGERIIHRFFNNLVEQLWVKSVSPYKNEINFNKTAKQEDK